MLLTFKCKSYPEVLMYQDHAKRILDLLHKDLVRGVITAEEAPHAVKVVEGEIEESRRHPPTDQVTRDVQAHRGEDPDNEHELIEEVSFPTRAFPLLEMLRSARDNKTDILWGV